MSDSIEKAKIAASGASVLATAGVEAFVFSHFLRQSMENALFQASVKIPFFSAMGALSVVSWFIDLIDYKIFYPIC